jgi:hypothetical protein
MAGYFVRQACPLIADDALPVRVGSDRVEAIPSLPLMKVADEAAAHALGLGRDFPGPVANLAKKIVAIGDALDPRLAFASAPTPLAAIYLLERQAPERLEPGAERLRTLDPSEGLAALLESTLYRTLLTPAERAHLFQAYVAVARNVPIRVLTFPSGFEYQERVYRRIRQDLEGL